MPPGFYKDTHTNTFQVVRVTHGPAVPKSRKGFRRLHPVTPISPQAKRYLAAESQTPRGVENSALLHLETKSHTLFCPCDQSLPKVCKKHRCCYPGKEGSLCSPQKRQHGCPGLHISEGRPATLSSSSARWRGPWAKSQATVLPPTCIYSSSHSLTCTPGINLLTAWKSSFSYLSLR